MPSEEARRFCQRIMLSSGTARAAPPDALTARKTCALRGGAPTAMPPARVAAPGVPIPAGELGGYGHDGFGLDGVQPGHTLHQPARYKLGVSLPAAHEQTSVADRNDDVVGRGGHLGGCFVGECLRSFHEVGAEIVGGIDQGVVALVLDGGFGTGLPGAGDGVGTGLVNADLSEFRFGGGAGREDVGAHADPCRVGGYGRAGVAGGIFDYLADSVFGGYGEHCGCSAVLEGSGGVHEFQLGEEVGRAEFASQLGNGDYRGVAFSQ